MNEKDIVSCGDCSCKAGIFKILSDEEFSLICRNRLEVSFNAGEMIFKQGSSLTHLVCITSGLAKVYFKGVEKKNLILRLARASELIGGPGMFVDARHYYSLGAVEDTTVCLIDIGHYREAVFRNKALAFEVMKRESQHRIELYEKLVNLTQKQMPGRIAEVLLYLSQEIYGGTRFSCTISRQELADLAAMSKESSIRILKDFKDEGYIKLEGNEFEILDIPALEHISQFG